MTKASRLDLVVMVDNSASMADKQGVLSKNIGDLLNQLPVSDVHVAVVTSSLGGHGSDICVEDSKIVPFNPTQNDRARPITRGPKGVGGTYPLVPTYQDAGFLAWDPGQQMTPPGEPGVMVVDQRPSARRRSVTACGLMSTTVDLAQPLHVGQILRPARLQLQADQALARHHAQLSPMPGHPLAALPDRLQRAVGEQDVEHQRPPVEDLSRAASRSASRSARRPIRSMSCVARGTPWMARAMPPHRA